MVIIIADFIEENLRTDPYHQGRSLSQKWSDFCKREPNDCADFASKQVCKELYTKNQDQKSCIYGINVEIRNTRKY